MNPLPAFLERTAHLPYKPKSVFPSEMFLFYLEALRVNPDLIIESGVGYGGSTSYLAALFPDEPPIIAIDKKLTDLDGFPPRVDFIPGDSLVIIPLMVRYCFAKRIAILIDGPKGDLAIDLAAKVIDCPSVAFVAVHDLAYDRPGRHPPQSHDPVFRDTYRFLDGKVPIEQLCKQPEGPGLTIFK